MGTCRRFTPFVALCLALMLPSIVPARAETGAECVWTPRPEADLRFGVADGWRNLDAAARSGASWDRIVFSWQYVQPAPDQWNAPYYFSDTLLCQSLANGLQVVGLLQDTPEWAWARPEHGATSPPSGLYEPWDSAENVWARFVERMAAEYRGRIDHWIIWNEPEFEPEDQGGLYVTWAGGPQDYYQLLKTAYRAAKAGNPDATVIFAATSYWIDVVNGRRQFLERVLEIAARDPEAREAGFFFDGLALNVYWAPDDIWGLAHVLRDILAAYGLTKQLWITETNAMPYDDPSTPKPPNGQRVTLREQSAFVIQAYAMGIAAGFDRIGWHAMTDRDTSDEIWGLARNDGSLRPAYFAYQIASRYLANADRVAFAPLARSRRICPTCEPGWQVYQVAFDRGTRRVTVLWNGEGQTNRVRVPRLGARAVLIDEAGRDHPLDVAGEYWDLELPPATARGPNDPPGYYYVGGAPRLLVEEGVPPGSPVAPPILAP